jgi:hypothetical protein
MCADLSTDVDWASNRPLLTWLEAIHNFYYPPMHA